MTLLQVQAQHLARLALAPGWREYVAARIEELESCDSGLWIGLKAAVNAAMRAAAKNKKESDE